MVWFLLVEGACRARVGCWRQRETAIRAVRPKLRKIGATGVHGVYIKPTTYSGPSNLTPDQQARVDQTLTLEHFHADRG
jgi:hypothetical protein